MPTLRKHIQHHFAGGWATDFGPTAPGVAPDQTGQFNVPFLVDAENVIYSLDGGPRKIPGSTKFNTVQLESGATITGLFDYWRQGTGGSPTQKRVIHVGEKIYKDDADGTFDQIGSGFVSGAVPNYATFDDFLIIASDDSADVPQSWDQTTFQALAGSPPNFSFSTKHKNFHFAAGVDANPSTLYFSSQLDPETWSGGTSGNIQIDPNDGDRITGIYSHRNELWIFKGPHKGSIHRLTGSSNSGTDAWARTTFIEGVGAVWQNSIFRLGDDLAFLWSDGSFRSLSATEAFGDFREASLSVPIQSWLDEHLTFTGDTLRKVWATPGPGGSRIYISLPIDSSTINNEVLILDLRFGGVRWSRAPALTATALSLVMESRVPTLMYGSTDGHVRKWNNSTRQLDGTAIAMKVTTPFFDYGAPHIAKTLDAFALSIQPKNSGNIVLGVTNDDQAQVTTNIAQGGVSTLGTFKLNHASLGVLGGANFINRWAELEEGGEFRTVQYQFTNSAASEDVEIHGFIAVVEPGAENLEN